MHKVLYRVAELWACSCSILLHRSVLQPQHQLSTSAISARTAHKPWDVASSL